MPTPTIPAGNLFMNATTYTGTGATQVITNGVTGQSFQPDFVWIKSRSAATSNLLYDSVRSATYYLVSNSTSTEGVGATTLTSFLSGGFQLGSDSGAAGVNVNAATYVGWQWKAGGTAVSNTAGSITSQVSANTTSGFSIVTYTGTGANATVGHGLGVAPQMIIVKTRSLSGENWNCWHTSLGGNTYRILLNTTGAVDTGSPTCWSSGGINPTSTTFTVGTNSGTNGSASTYVAYCWAPIAGYSAFGSYTGNGSADGVFIYLGFRPRWVMIKCTGVDHWNIEDSSRNTYNPEQTRLLTDDPTSEQTSSAYYVDYLSNGFKLRTTDVGFNGSASTYIYAAFAENPFKYANAR